MKEIRNAQAPTENPKRVVVGLSGGVDSSVAAALLQAAGFEVHGLAIETWHATPTPNTPPTAASIAQKLSIPLHTVDLREIFYSTVVTPFLEAYSQGLTPNPCVHCNLTFKFAALLTEAERIAARWIATGHYARVIHAPPAATRLLQAKDPHKDQSYALYRLTQTELTRLQLPLGDITSKAAVRDLAQQYNLPSAATRDSQDLCFMNGASYHELLEQLTPQALRPGPILDESGRQLGEHRGLPCYTVGQRSGLGIAAAERLYVLRLDPQANTLIVGPQARLEHTTCRIAQLTFTSGHPPANEFPALARIRYRAALVPTQVSLQDQQHAALTFAQPQRGVAPGQSVVLYNEEQVLGGGVIIG